MGGVEHGFGVGVLQKVQGVDVGVGVDWQICPGCGLHGVAVGQPTAARVGGHGVDVGVGVGDVLSQTTAPGIGTHGVAVGVGQIGILICTLACPLAFPDAVSNRPD